MALEGGYSYGAKLLRRLQSAVVALCSASTGQALDWQAALPADLLLPASHCKGSSLQYFWSDRIARLSATSVMQTSRPAVTRQYDGSNPYTLESTADLAVQLCHALQFRRVFLAGHADGAIAAVIAAAKLQQAERQKHG